MCEPQPWLRPDAIAAVLAASNVATWEWDAATDLTRCCATAATFFGLTPQEGRRGLTPQHFIMKIVPEDRPAHAERLRRCQERGGLFVTEYRTEPRPGEIRWLLVRGGFDTNDKDVVTGARGILVDITASRESGQLDAHQITLEQGNRKGSPLDRIADLLLAAHSEASMVGDRTLISILRLPLLHVASRLARTIKGTHH